MSASTSRLLRAGTRRRHNGDGHIPVLRYQGDEIWCDVNEARPEKAAAHAHARQVRALLLPYLERGQP